MECSSWGKKLKLKKGTTLKIYSISNKANTSGTGMLTFKLSNKKYIVVGRLSEKQLDKILNALGGKNTYLEKWFMEE